MESEGKQYNGGVFFDSISMHYVAFLENGNWLATGLTMESAVENLKKTQKTNFNFSILINAVKEKVKVTQILMNESELN